MFTIEELEKHNRIGKGCEGTVYKLDNDLVCKIWHKPFGRRQSSDNLLNIVKSILDVDRFLKEKIQNEIFKSPELVGYTIIDEIMVTFHQYINGEDASETELNEKGLYKHGYITDSRCRGNVIKSGENYYLVDVLVDELLDKDN